MVLACCLVAGVASCSASAPKASEEGHARVPRLGLPGHSDWSSDATPSGSWSLVGRGYVDFSAWFVYQSPSIPAGGVCLAFVPFPPTSNLQPPPRSMVPTATELASAAGCQPAPRADILDALELNEDSVPGGDHVILVGDTLPYVTSVRLGFSGGSDKTLYPASGAFTVTLDAAQRPTSSTLMIGTTAWTTCHVFVYVTPLGGALTVACRPVS